MRLYLQFGYGMMGHCDELLSNDVGAGVILSPRDLTLDQLVSVASRARELSKAVLFDPQCYIRDADHARLTQHAYWQAFRRTSTSNVLTGNGAADIVRPLGIYNAALATDFLILPA